MHRLSKTSQRFNEKRECNLKQFSDSTPNDTGRILVALQYFYLYTVGKGKRLI